MHVPQESGTWWYVDDSPHLASSYLCRTPLVWCTVENYPCVLGFASFSPIKKLRYCVVKGAQIEAQIWKIRASEQARRVKTVKAHSCDS